jgi:hypothetical protein
MKHLSISLSLSIYHLPSLSPKFIRKLTDHRASHSENISQYSHYNKNSQIYVM